tara:strand:- start:65 stop:385 length:321 start_codon:yes stop_codon:yes gene_type:complete
MIEFMTTIGAIEKFSTQNQIDEDIVSYFFKKIPTSWIIAALLVSIGASYLAYQCSSNEKPATRALYTIFAFFFSGFYLIYYFIVHVVLGYQCFDGKNISNIIKGKK